ncbi:AAA family ATPase [Actinoplanes sp. NPDC049598]|uniref:helix-turn-helix transcriptional regulator n=1 Tax=Actinoplanes sp. NPDC049598 TaxID=3154626 RepID=UPI0034491792
MPNSGRDGLFGRDDELRLITELIEGGAESGGGLLLRGDAGIGKSSLLIAAVTVSTSMGREVLRTTGVEAEAELPFAGLHQLLRPLMAAVDHLPITQRRALLTAFGADDGPPPEPFMIALAALNLITEAAGRRPVVIVADDVHWLDRSTHEVLAFVIRRISADPVVLVGAIRTGHDGPLLHAGAPLIELSGLPDAAARQLVAVTAADLPPAGRERIVREGLGNPLALVELPIAWRAIADPSTGPPRHLPLTARLERAFGGRLAALPRLTRDALLVAAVDQSEDLAEILAATSLLAGAEVTTHAWTPAVEAGLVRLDESRVTFRHPLVRSGIVQAETLPRRQAANAALAAVLDGEPYRRSWHRAQSIVGPDDEVADDLEATHRIPLSRGAVAAAIWSLQRSAQLTTDEATRGHRLLLAAEHAFGAGRADLVERLVAEAGGCALSALDRARLEWLREILNDGVPGDARRILELCDLARRCERTGDRELALKLLHGAALRAWWAPAGRAAQDAVVATANGLPGVGDNPWYLAAIAVAHPTQEGPAAAAALARVVPDEVTDPYALFLYGMAAHAIGHSESAVAFLGRAERRLRDSGRLGLLSQVLTMQVMDRMELGDWEQARTAVEEARHLAADTGQAIWDTGSLVNNAMVLSLSGDLDQARSMADRVEQAAGSRRLNNLLACARLARGFCDLRSGRPADAYGHFRRMFDPAEPAFHESERIHAVAPLAEAARGAGLEEEARLVLAGFEGVARHVPVPALHIHLEYARAVLAPDEDAAEPLFKAALSRDLTGWPWHRARLELAYGSWLRRRRRTTASRSPLRTARAVFERIGATSWADQAASELRAAGERPAVTGQPGRDLLTAQELQVARLAAAGLSNREIGQQLYLSPRTVGSILYRLFPKLGISSRTQLATRLGAATPR